MTNEFDQQTGNKIKKSAGNFYEILGVDVKVNGGVSFIIFLDFILKPNF